MSPASVVRLGYFLLAVGCQTSTVSVGQTCQIGTIDNPPPETTVATPAPECESSVCLHYVGSDADQCTAECTLDADCRPSPSSSCSLGFACMPVVDVGPFCCRAMCVCRDHLQGDGGSLAPLRCDPANPEHECCNLPDRPSCS